MAPPKKQAPGRDPPPEDDDDDETHVPEAPDDDEEGFAFEEGEPMPDDLAKELAEMQAEGDQGDKFTWKDGDLIMIDAADVEGPKPGEEEEIDDAPPASKTIHVYEDDQGGIEEIDEDGDLTE